jgi:hypothetical protein
VINIPIKNNDRIAETALFITNSPPLKKVFYFSKGENMWADKDLIRHIFQHHLDTQQNLEKRELFQGLFDLNDEEMEEFEKFSSDICSHLLDKFDKEK